MMVTQIRKPWKRHYGGNVAIARTAPSLFIILIVAVGVGSELGWGHPPGETANDHPPGETTIDIERRKLSVFPGTVVYRPTVESNVALVVLHGSEGGAAGYSRRLAFEVAKNGVMATSFCWYRCEGLSDQIYEVELGRLLEFVDWLRANYGEELSVVLFGASRGAEHVLLLASMLRNDAIIQGIAVHAGTDTVVASFDPTTGKAVLDENGEFGAAWTCKGSPIHGERRRPWGSGPRIRIEDYSGPVWLSHGVKDSLWPVDRSYSIEKARKGLTTLSTYWPNEGHIVNERSNVLRMLESLVNFVHAASGSRRRLPPDVEAGTNPSLAHLDCSQVQGLGSRED